MYIKLPNMSTAADFTVTLAAGAHADHVGVEQCDTVTHHQIQPQMFKFDQKGAKIPAAPYARAAWLLHFSNTWIYMAGTGQIKCVDPKCKGGGANGMCVTTGKDDEPIARTLAIEMQTCARYTEKTLPKAPARNAWITDNY